LMHQRGGVERLPLLPGQLAPGHGVQFLVERGQDPVERAPVAAAGGIEPEGDICGIRHARRAPFSGPDYTAKPPGTRAPGPSALAVPAPDRRTLADAGLPQRSPAARAG